MRRFSFRAKNIGRERYLTYICGEGTEIDEDALDYCEEGEIKELIKTIYEEDDDYDYITFDVTGKTSVERFTEGVVDKETVFKLIRNIAIGLINLKEQAVHLSYLLLNRSFIYVNPNTLEIQFICLPIESEGKVVSEFKGFVRQLIANMKFNVEEELSYVGQLLTYINGDSFNLRGLISLTEALMTDSGIGYDEEESIATEDGNEVVTEDDVPMDDADTLKAFMESQEGADEPLPEIGGDDEEESADDASEDEGAGESFELDDVMEAAEYTTGILRAREAAIKEQEAAAAEAEDEDDDEDEDDGAPQGGGILSRLFALAEDEEGEEEAEEEKAEHTPDHTPLRVNNGVKVNRAAMIQNAEAAEKEKVDESGDVAGTDLLRGEHAEESEGETSEENAVVAVAPANPANIKINPYLIRETTEEKTIIAKPIFKIGKANRGVDYHISGNSAISRVHAIITRKDDGFYIKDNKSTNHTYVNGKRLEEGEEILLKNNARIKLGDEEFIFKF